MSDEEMITALNELKEAAEDMIKLSKRLSRETKRGVDLTDYRAFQDIYFELEKSKSIMKAKLMDWEDSLPEDGDGDIVYPDTGVEGFEFTPVKSKIMFRTVTDVLEAAELALARFVVSLNPTQHARFRDDAKIKVLCDRNYTELIFAPHIDEDSDTSTLVPDTVRQEVPRVPQPMGAGDSPVPGAGQVGPLL